MKQTVHVDLVSELAITPGITLLMKHLHKLGVELHLLQHPEQATHSRLLLLPKRKFSRWDAEQDPATVPRPDNVEIVALYLDPSARAVHADAHFRAVQWPARSSDQQMLRLAHHLKTPYVPAPPPAAEARPRPLSLTTLRKLVVQTPRRLVWTLSLVGMAGGGYLIVGGATHLADEAHLLPKQSSSTQSPPNPSNVSEQHKPAARLAPAGTTQPGLTPVPVVRSQQSEQSEESEESEESDESGEPGSSVAHTQPTMGMDDDGAASEVSAAISTAISTAIETSSGTHCAGPLCTVQFRYGDTNHPVCTINPTPTLPLAATDASARTTTPAAPEPTAPR